MAGCGRRFIVCLDRLSCAFGEFVGGSFGARVDGFEGEERGCLDGGEMLCEEETCRAKMPAPMMAIPIDIFCLVLHLQETILRGGSWKVCNARRRQAGEKTL